MKEKIDIQLEFLSELNEICAKNDLKYILLGKSALNGYQNKTLKNGSRYVSVAMTNGDIERFCEIIERDYSENRYVEGIFNNPFFWDFGEYGTPQIRISPISYVSPNLIMFSPNSSNNAIGGSTFARSTES